MYVEFPDSYYSFRHNERGRMMSSAARHSPRASLLLEPQDRVNRPRPKQLVHVVIDNSSSESSDDDESEEKPTVRHPMKKMSRIKSQIAWSRKQQELVAQNYHHYLQTARREFRTLDQRMQEKIAKQMSKYKQQQRVIQHRAEELRNKMNQEIQQHVNLQNMLAGKLLAIAENKCDQDEVTDTESESENEEEVERKSISTSVGDERVYGFLAAKDTLDDL